MKVNLISTIAAIALFTLAGCSGGSSDDGTSELDTQIRSLTTLNGITGNALDGIDKPAGIDTPKAQLGMKLFFSKALGGDQDSACVTCHHPVLGGGDNLSLPIGTEAVLVDLLGVGRTYDRTTPHGNTAGDALVPRNAPTTYNMALWTKGLFWDGRVENNFDAQGNVTGIRTPDSAFGSNDPDAGINLTVAQARFPVTSPEEMRGHSFELGTGTQAARNHLTARINDAGSADYISNNTWEAEFAPVYGDDNVTFKNIVDAIGAYENSQVFIESPWKNYVMGDSTAINASAKRGAKLFYSSVADGGMSCVSCHSGNFFTDENYHVMALPQVGKGKGNGVDGYEDFGRFRESNDAADKFAFRTPTLLNVSMTGPYGHAGSYVTLKDMVSHMVNPEKSIEEYDASKLASDVDISHLDAATATALAELRAEKAAGASFHQTNLDATDENINDLVSFLEALTDPCLNDKECIGKWIAEETVVDGLELNAVDENGEKLKDLAL